MRRRVLHAVGAILACRAGPSGFLRRRVAQQATTLALSSRSAADRGPAAARPAIGVAAALGRGPDALRGRACGFTRPRGSLERRFASARLHYDLGRRYADRSFCQSARRSCPRRRRWTCMPPSLLKIQTHYVEEPNWRQLLGTAATTSRSPWASRSSASRTFRRATGRRSKRSAWKRGRRSPRGPWQPPGRLRRRGGRRRPGPATPGDAAGGGDPGVPLRGGQRTGSLLDLPHPGPTRRSLFANRGQLRRPGGRAEDPGRRAGRWCGSSAAAPPNRPGSMPATASSPSTAGRSRRCRPTRRPTCCKAARAPP